MKRRLGALLFVAIVVAQLATVAVLLISSHQFRHAAQDKETRLELSRQGAEMAARVEDYLRPAEVSLRTTTSLLSRDVALPEELVPTLVGAMNQSPQISELSMAMASGSSFTLTRQGDRLLLLAIDAPGGVGASWTRSFDSEGRTIETTEAVPGRFKEWSAADLDVGSERFPRAEWSDPYVVFRSLKLGISTSQLVVSQSGELTGIARASVELGPLSTLLGAENLAGGVIINDAGLVLAHSNPALAQSLGRLGLEPRQVADLDDQSTHVALAAVLGTDEIGDDGIVHLAGTTTMVASTTVHAGTGEWSIVLYGSPEEVLPRTIADNDREARFMQTVGVLAVFLAGCAAYPTTRRLCSLQRHATTDNLTGLANRRSVLHAGRTALEHGVTGIVAIDVDNFKKVNDTFGHAVGDEVLVEVARRISRCIRRSDHAGRIGGEEFLVVFDLDNPEDLASLARRMHDAIGTEPFHTGAGELRVTASFGIASGNNTSDFTRVVAAADDAMYRAKRAGRNQVIEADASETQPADETQPAGEPRETSGQGRTDRRRTARR